MKRSLFLLSGLSLCNFVLAGENPNVLFILFDDFGTHQLGCYGSTFYETPNIDQIAADGIRFTNAYAAASVSSPTRAALMSGKYPARVHLTDWLNGNKEPDNLTLSCPNWIKGLPASELRLPQLMKNNGYATSLIGKWHVSSALNGWDEVLRYDGPKDLCENDDCHRVEEYTDAAIDFITRKKNEKQPFFCFLSHNAIHTPETEENNLVAKYRTKEGSTEGGLLNPVQAAMVERLDNETGRLLKAITELGLDNNTIIIIYADNGQFSPQEKIGAVPLRGAKVTLWEGGVREPLLIRWKGEITPGVICNQQVISQDFLPTIADLCGITMDDSKEIDGISFADNLLKNPEAPINREYICWHYPHYHPEAQFIGSIRKGDWKLIENFDNSLYFQDNAFELYNLKDDEKESVNLVDRLPAKAAELYADLQNWRKETNAQMPLCKNSVYGKAHFLLHTINVPFKINEFEEQTGIVSGLQFDGEGTFMALKKGNTLNYLIDIPAQGNYIFKVLCKNNESKVGSITLKVADTDKSIAIPTTYGWQQPFVILPIQEKGIYRLTIKAESSLSIDKLIIANQNEVLVHDGKFSETPEGMEVKITFEEEEPIYTSITGNSNHQNPTPTVMDNPFRDIINPTNKCISFRSKQDIARSIPGWNANNLIISFKKPIKITAGNKYLHIMHWKERVLNTWVVYGRENSAADYVELGRGNCPMAKMWFDIVVDVSSKLTQVESIKIIADGNWSGSGEDRYYPPTTFCYDEIVFNSVFSQRTQLPPATSIDNVQQENDEINVFPNPIKNTFTIKSNRAMKTISIFSLNGEIMKNIKVNDSLEKVVTIEKLMKAFYILHIVYIDGSSSRMKIIKID